GQVHNDRAVAVDRCRWQVRVANACGHAVLADAGYRPRGAPTVASIVREEGPNARAAGVRNHQSAARQCQRLTAQASRHARCCQRRPPGAPPAPRGPLQDESAPPPAAPLMVPMPVERPGGPVVTGNPWLVEVRPPGGDGDRIIPGQPAPRAADEELVRTAVKWKRLDQPNAKGFVVRHRRVAHPLISPPATPDGDPRQRAGLPGEAIIGGGCKPDIAAAPIENAT